MKTVTGLREEKGAAQNTLRRRLLRALKRAVLVVVCVYILLLAVLYFAQRRLIFHAASTRRGAGAQAVPPPGVEKVSFRTAQGDSLVGFFGRALTPNGLPDPAAAHRQTLLFFYGKGECVAACRPQMQAFRRLGLNVLIPDYPGFGMSRGRESEAGCYAAADAAYTYLRRRPRSIRNASSCPAFLSAPPSPSTSPPAGWPLASRSWALPSLAPLRACPTKPTISIRSTRRRCCGG